MSLELGSSDGCVVAPALGGSVVGESLVDGSSDVGPSPELGSYVGSAVSSDVVDEAPGSVLPSLGSVLSSTGVWVYQLVEVLGVGEPTSLVVETLKKSSNPQHMSKAALREIQYAVRARKPCFFTMQSPRSKGIDAAGARELLLRNGQLFVSRLNTGLGAECQPRAHSASGVCAWRLWSGAGARGPFTYAQTEP
ncbi:hypothetical protein [Streptomyces umbrinus]|uniref:hypothetical protein n=1 Tax=Streptomyces umbrinus TaxID=67370 RepID=UPI0034443C6C